MCLAADVPLLESGTSGYVGQVQPIKRETTECFDCTGAFFCAPLWNWSVPQTDAAGCASALPPFPLPCRQARAQDVRSVHDPQHALDRSPLHRLGKVVPLPVRRPSLLLFFLIPRRLSVPVRRGLTLREM